MGMPSERNALWNVARDCAAQRIHKHCKESFGSMECNSCRYYIYNYTNAEPAKINLLMLQAEDSAAALVDLVKEGNRAIIAIILIPIAVLVGLYYLNNSKWFNGPLTPPTKGAVEARYSDDENAVQSTLQKVAKGMTKKTDVNKDGKVNCIDAALLFYRYYPDKNKVRVYWNSNEAKDFNHLFNLVLVNGEWMGVEPQAKFCGYDSYRMRPIWGDKYDYRLNKDVTDSWLQYLN